MDKYNTSIYKNNDNRKQGQQILRKQFIVF